MRGNSEDSFCGGWVLSRDAIGPKNKKELAKGARHGHAPKELNKTGGENSGNPHHLLSRITLRAETSRGSETLGGGGI